MKKLMDKIEMFFIKKIIKKMLKENNYDCVRYIERIGKNND